MSTLNVSNITDGTDTVGTSYVVNGSAKAWVNFNGTGTIATRDSLNVSSLTDLSAGEYQVNFSSNMANTNYCASGTTNNKNVADDFRSAGYNAVGTSFSNMNGQLVGSISIGSYVSGSGFFDAILCYLAVHGDLA